MTTTPTPPSSLLAALLGEADRPSPLMGDPAVAAALDCPPPTLRRCHLVEGIWHTRVHAHWASVYQGLGLPDGWMRLFWDCRGADDETRALQRLRSLLVQLTSEPAAAHLTVAQVLSAVLRGLVGNGHDLGALFRPGAMRAHLDTER